MIWTVEQIVFWTCVLLLAYVYVGYPLLVFFISQLFPHTVKRGEIEPKVTILITAFNEEAAIRQKLENTLEIDYPMEKLEIIVASDGSTDETDRIVGEFRTRGVKLFRQEGRVGKTTTQNNAIMQSTGDIVLFSDATTDYGKDVLSHVLPPFADESVGCVAGRLVYLDHESTNVGKGAQNYWNYETFLKSAESRACSLIGASGCLYAVRREAYEPMYAEACSDFLICTMLFRKGLRSVFAPDAVCYEHTNRHVRDELRMRVRVISQTFSDLWRNRDMLNPFRGGIYAIELISHKLLRYAVPLILIVMLIANISLASSSPLYIATLMLQLSFYILAFVGWLIERRGMPSGLLAMPLYFTLANFASVVGFYKFLRGEKYARWEPIRHTR
jgi:cellulose synthase/poly-beta-1,6-N-acetylglucosamine synthase-like glycosyltransferase